MWAKKNKIGQGEQLFQSKTSQSWQAGLCHCTVTLLQAAQLTLAASGANPEMWSLITL